MKIRSFQFKIALVSLLLSGLALGVFGALAWTAFYRFGLERIDLEIRSWEEKQLSKFLPLEEWQRFEADMDAIFGAQKPHAITMLVKGRLGRTLLQSANWPSNLDPKKFPSPQELNIPLPPHRPPPPPPPPRFDAGPEAPPENEEHRPWENASHLTPSKFLTHHVGTQSWRVGVMSNEHATLVMGVNLEGLLGEMRQVRLAFLTALPGTLLLIAGAGWLVSRRALRPVRRVTETAKRVTAQGLDQRIPAKMEDIEFEELVTVLNQMLDRLQGSFQQATRFSADAAHELKTPLTILQGELEEALRLAPADSAQQRVFLDLMDEVQRLKAIIQKLLLLTKADAGQLQLHLETVELNGLVEEIVEDTAILAPHLSIRKDLLAEADLLADGGLLRQALQNLASNAIKYNRPDGSILLGLKREDALIRFTIANTGDPIPPQEREKIFERFYRGDKARGRRVDGVGLGLSLAREIVRAHGGDLFLDESTPGLTTFTVLLPVDPQDKG